MSWYYTREPGADGQVITDEGTPEGVSLTEFLRSGPLPMRAGLELVAFMADILTIAEEDDALHGDLKPGCVLLGAGGEVSIEGYGVTRRGGRAPEGRPVGVKTDTYGLGVVLHAVLSCDSMGAVPRDRDGHDDAIVDKLLSIDWGEMSDKKWLDPVLHFLCSMLAFEPGERPAPLDVANILAEVALQVPGKSLTPWAARAVPAAGGAQSPRPMTSSQNEDLSGPQSLGRAVPNTGGFTRRQAASAKGQCTAFWTREKITAMLDEDSEVEVEPLGRGGRALPPPPSVPPVRPEVGRVSVAKTGLGDYPTGIPMSPDVTITGQDDPELREVLRAIRAGEPIPDTFPASSAGEDAQGGAHGVHPPLPSDAESSWSGETRTGDGIRSRQGPDAAARTSDSDESMPPPAVPPAQAPPFEVAVGRADPGTASPRSQPASDRRASTQMPWLAISFGMGSVLIALSLIVVAVVIYLVQRPEPGAVDEVSVLETLEDVVVDRDTGSSDAALERDAKRTRTKRTKRSPSKSSLRTPPSRPTPSRTSPPPTRPSRSTPSPPRTGPPTPRSAPGEFVVRFRSMGAEARIECGDGQAMSFVGTTRRVFRGVTTCRVKIGGTVGTVQVRRAASVTCNVTGSTVTCRGA